MVDIAEFEDILAVSWQTRSEIDWLVGRLTELKPRRILEIGVAQGGTSGIFSRIVGEDGLVVGLDIRDTLLDPRIRDLANHRLVLGDSHDPAVFDRVRSLSDTYDFMLIDGDHSVGGVQMDTDMYLPLLREGGLAVWHDVRLDPTEGIKQVWYRELRRRMLGSFEHFASPYNNGYGVWYKTPVTVDDFEEEALAASARGEDRREAYEKIVGNDPTRITSWRGLLGDASRSGDQAAVRRARIALSLLSPPDPDTIAALRERDGTADDPELTAALDALDAEARTSRRSADGHRRIALAASRHGQHEVAEERIALACAEEGANLAMRLDRVSILEASDAPVADVAAALQDAIAASAAPGVDADTSRSLEETIPRVMTIAHLLQKYETAAGVVPSVLRNRPDLLTSVVEILTNLAVLALRDGARGEGAARIYCPLLRDCVRRTGTTIDATRRRMVDVVLARAGFPSLSEGA